MSKPTRKIEVRFSNKSNAKIYLCDAIEVHRDHGEKSTGFRTTLRKVGPWGSICINGKRWTNQGRGGNRYDTRYVPISIKNVKITG